MANLPGGWIADLFGYKDILDRLGNLLPRRKAIRFLGAAVADNPTLGVTDVNFSAPFRGVYYVDPLSTGTEVGSELAPFRTAGAAIAYGVAQGVSSAVLLLPPGATLTESFTLPSSGNWEIATNSSFGSVATIIGNIICDTASGGNYTFSRIIHNGNLSAVNSGHLNAFVFYLSAFAAGNVSLGSTAAGKWTLDCGGYGGDFAGNSGDISGTVSVAGSIIAHNFSYFGNVTYTARSRFNFVAFNQSLSIAMANALAETVMLSCQFGGSVTIVGTGSPQLSVDGSTLANMLSLTAATVVTGVPVKTINSNGSLDSAGAPTNATTTALSAGIPGMFIARAMCHLVTSGGTGTLLFDVNYTDATGHAKTIAVTTTGLVLSGAVAAEDAASSRPFFHDGSSSITITSKGVTGAGSVVRSVYSCERLN